MLALGVLAILGVDAGISGAGPIAQLVFDPNIEQVIRQQIVAPSSTSLPEVQMTVEIAKVFYVVAGFSTMVVGVLLWINSRIAEGGLIASAQQIERGQASSFAHSWMGGRGKMASLAATGLIVLLPAGALSLTYSITSAVSSLVPTQQSLDSAAAPDTRLLVTWLGYTCASLLLGVPLTLVRTLADRAVTLDGLRAGAAVQRGLAVLRARLGQVLVVALIEIGARLMIAVVVGGAAYCALIGLLVAGIATAGAEQGLSGALAVAVCCLLPPLLLVGGALQSYFATLWTLAWRAWTAKDGEGGVMVKPLPEKVGQ